jgi:xanthine dehydrogenase accessory factor
MTAPLPFPADRFDAMLHDLRARGEPFALATVVRTVDATSAKPGAKAIILPDGTIAEGWIGGGCARSAVTKAGVAAIREGKPQFVSLRPEELLAAEGVQPGDERAGIRFARNGCPSKGSMDVFVEPVLPRPQLVILGEGPVALALADLSERFGFHRIHAAPGLAASVAEEARDGFDSLPPFGGQRFIIVATQGKGDEAGLRAALATGADHVAFVGSRRKFATLADRLRAGGIGDAALTRVKAPAGLDIHAITPEEIALSILAEITILRRAGGRGADSIPVEEAPTAEAAPEERRPGLLSRLFTPTAEQADRLLTRRPCC